MPIKSEKWRTRGGVVDEDISRRGGGGSEELEERAPAVPRPPAIRPPVEVGKGLHKYYISIL